MQGVAWVGMTISYSTDSGIVEGVKKTFDGQHPCRMCRAIAEVREHQTDHPAKPATKPEFKFSKILKDVSLPSMASLPSVVRNEIYLAEETVALCPKGIWNLAPPVPPPRLA